PIMKIAIIGTGGMANNHAKQFSTIDGVQVVAGLDLDAERAKKFCETHNIPHACTDIEQLFAEVDFDAVTVVTADSHHYAPTLKAIAAGKHVLCEKPLATNYADAKKMADAAQSAGVINMVNFSYRNSSAIQMATDWIAEG